MYIILLSLKQGNNKLDWVSITLDIAFAPCKAHRRIKGNKEGSSPKNLWNDIQTIYAINNSYNWEKKGNSQSKSGRKNKEKKENSQPKNGRK